MTTAETDTAPEAPKPKPRDVLTRWGGDPTMLSRGFVGVPILFLENFANLKPYQLNPAEVVFIISLMAHKWGDDAPFPGYKKLAKWMGKTESYARTLARNLETKGLLSRVTRVGRTNKFDLSPLFAAVVKGNAATSGQAAAVAHAKIDKASPRQKAAAKPKVSRARKGRKRSSAV